MPVETPARHLQSALWRAGLIALPQVWLFQIALRPGAARRSAAGLQLVGQAIRLFAAWRSIPEQRSSHHRHLLLRLHGGGSLGRRDRILMERSEGSNLLWWLMLQRFGYRQIMYYVVVESVARALQGRFVGWGKLSARRRLKQWRRRATKRGLLPSLFMQRRHDRVTMIFQGLSGTSFSSMKRHSVLSLSAMPRN